MLAIAVFVVLVIITIGLGVRIVPQGSKHVVQRLGKFHKTLGPGLNIIVPYVDSVAYRVSTKDIVLDVGALKLNALIVGDLPIPFNLLHFSIYTAGATDAEGTLVADKVSPNDILTLNAGTYHVAAYFGDVNAVVRADLRVEPGQLTEATLYEKGAQVSFKLVSEAGGEAIADIDWTVQASDGSSVFTNTGTFPATVLEAGTYTVTAKRGGHTYTKQFEVKPGPAQDIEVVTTAG